MKSGIHPAYGETSVVCGCGNSFQTRSTKDGGHIVVEVCSQCHPFYTGKQKILDSGGRVARFEKRYGKRPSQEDRRERLVRQLATPSAPVLSLASRQIRDRAPICVCTRRLM